MKTPLSKIIGSTILATGVALSFIAAPAQAVKISGGGGGDDTGGVLSQCSTSDISLGGVLGDLVDATACKGAFGENDTGKQGTLLGKLDAGLFATEFDNNEEVSWSLLAKSDETNNLFDAKENFNTGDWSFKQALSTDTFVLSLKSSTGYSAYLFKDYDWTKGLTGIFNTIGVSTNKGQGQALSHASLFAANVTTVTPPPVEVPEPATLVGLGLAFGGMLASRRRQSH
ncbi:conserved exported hypothetical protein [Planktothrix serta PCC 8927]|uniref:Ice-binding protein C-terminal domain-containing protein n=1 Tax=Planktothrix serta PCC 8927 TaxID=671068 RepID=A0A7Z9BLQ7_9CYAN|nr:PEP-CTERM sorting domain-containing protein [Planktothrix serta]VXD17000.1 conserved exported hypothetical protein [Planktothrix serta PCC 8927]